jgi:hypothetical protein
VAYTEGGGITGKVTVMKFKDNNWVPVGNPGFSDSSAYAPALALDSNNYSYVAYIDWSGGKTTVMRFDGVNWLTVGTPAFGAGSVQNGVSLALDSKNVPYVAYTDTNGKATVMKFDGTNWGPVGNPGFSAGKAYLISLALDSSNHPYVAYEDPLDGFRANVMKFDGASWGLVGNNPVSAGQVGRTPLALDSSDAPYVAYTDYANGKKPTVKRFKDNQWETVGNPSGFSGGVTSLALDSSNFPNVVPYVAYFDFAYSNAATVIKLDGNNWIPVGNPGFSTDSVYLPSLALASNNVPYVAYTESSGANVGKVTVMKYDPSPPPPPSLGWVNVGSPGFSTDYSMWANIAIDSNDIPYVAYQDNINYGSKGYVKTFDGTDWITLGDSLPGASYISLAIGSTNTPYVAYQDYFSGCQVTVKKYDGNSWVTVGKPGISGGLADYISLAIDSKGFPYVAYRDFTTNDQGVTVKKFVGSNWVTVGKAGFSADTAYDISLAIGPNNIPYVAYVDVANNLGVTVKRFDAGADEWETVGQAGFSAGEAMWTNIAVDSNNNPYVAYQDRANGYKASVMMFDSINDTWGYVGGAPGISAGWAAYTSLAFDSTDMPYVAYQDFTGKATVKQFNGTDWIEVGNPGFSAGGVIYTSLAINSSNVPYVAYGDGAYGYQATVMKYQ